MAHETPGRGVQLLQHAPPLLQVCERNMHAQTWRKPFKTDVECTFSLLGSEADEILAD